MTKSYTAIKRLIELDINLVTASSVADIRFLWPHLRFVFHCNIWIFFNLLLDLYLNFILVFSLVLLQILCGALVKETAEWSSKE